MDKLLVLDDDEAYANLLVDVAISVGWDAVSEQDPKIFLASDLCEDNILLVLDLNMPGMDGIEVIRALAAKKVDLFLVLISGFDQRVLHSAQQLAEAHNINVLASFPKPVVIAEFTKMLDGLSKDTGINIKSKVSRQDVTLEELDKAIKEHQLILYYQPQINMNSDELCGVEALVRWLHPERGMIFPDQFITLAEENGMIGRLTEEVINIAANQSQIWKNAGFDIIISVNVSAENIASLSLPEQLKALMDKKSIDPGRITLELTESSVMGELTASLDVLNRLRMKGFSLSIDDFGTGYSSLTQLYRAPFTELKIDQHFIMRMLDDTEALVIVKICIMLGQMLGMTLVAEGVETKEIWDQLEDMGCDVAQGYFMARPMPADEIIDWNNNRK